MILLLAVTVLCVWCICTQVRVTRHSMMIQAINEEQERQAVQLAKHEEKLQKFYYRLEKAEDEIAHFTELFDRLEEQKAVALEEIESINSRLEHADGVLDPLNARDDDRFNVSSTNADGMLLYMDMYSSTLDDKRTAKQKHTDAEKLRKRKATLETKIIRLDNQMFSAEQRIKKALHDRDTARKQIGA